MSLTLGPIFNAQHGKVREWSIVLSMYNADGVQVPIRSTDAAVPDGHYTIYQTVSGYSGMKMTTSADTIVTVGKNLGRKNETNPLTQAFKECQSKFAAKIKAGYSEHLPVQADEGSSSSKQTSTVPFPMAVKTWKDHHDKLQYPLYIQPKLDGVRMLAVYDNGDVKLYTRRLHDIVGFTNIKTDLKKMFETSGLKTFIVDGELYSHGTSLQTISGIVRNEGIGEDIKDTLQYFIFDCFDVNQPTMGFEDRFKLLRQFVTTMKTRTIKLNDTIYVEKPLGADKYYAMMTGQGYEGIIYKSASRPYEFSFDKEKRSQWYLKRKHQDDDEYPIVGFAEGKGKDVGCIVFVLKLPNGKTFNCVPNGSYDYRRQLYAQATTSFQTEFKDKLAKVVYDDLSKSGVPLRGRIVHNGRDLTFD